MGRRNPDKVPTVVNSVQARLTMKRKADAAVIDKAKLINRNWREVKIWGKSVIGRLPMKTDHILSLFQMWK
jgi:hypothetical protein